MWCSLLDLKMNAQSFRLRPAAFWEMQVEILPVGVWTHGWLRPHAVKYRYISMWVQKKTQMRVGKGKRWGVMPLVKCNVAIATSAFGCRLKYVWEKKKTALFESTSQWCINDLIDVSFFHVMSPQEQKMRLPIMCCICAVWKKVDIRSRKHCWITGKPICVGIKALWVETSGPVLLRKLTQTLLNPGWQRLVNFFFFFFFLFSVEFKKKIIIAKHQRMCGFSLWLSNRNWSNNVLTRCC